MTEYIRDDLPTSRNRDVQAGKETDRPCPQCGKDPSDPDGLKYRFQLHVRLDLEGTATLECPNCMYTENIPSDHLANK